MAFELYNTIHLEGMSSNEGPRKSSRSFVWKQEYYARKQLDLDRA